MTVERYIQQVSQSTCFPGSHRLMTALFVFAPPVLLGGTSCEIENQCGVVTLRPLPGQVCIVNGREVTEPCRLAQGNVILTQGSVIDR